jgi:DNA-directed RNA polymerase subunit beta'
LLFTVSLKIWEQNMLNETQALRITLASPEQMRAQSSGEVRKPETIHFRTQKPEPSGLFCERIFGPIKDWCCSCGKYKRERPPGFRCEKCGVEVTRSSVRRERMGHIELAVPVAHPWFARSAPSIIAILLDLSTRELRTLLSYSASIVLEIEEAQRAEVLERLSPSDEMYAALTGLAVGTFLSEEQYRALSRNCRLAFRAGTGAEAVRERLEDLDLQQMVYALREAIKVDPQHQKKAMKRLQIVSAFLESGIDPTFMILDVIPVLPPELRPLVPLGGGRFAASDVNSLYERVLHRNNRIKKFMANGAPDPILNHEKRLLQEAVDALFDNAHCPRPVLGTRRRPLKSLTDTLKGKEGRFRRNLLGKRVDYSGRSVIVGDATLSLHQCGLPTKICLELFKPFLIRKLVERNYAPSVRVAKRMIERTERHDPVIWDTLSEVLHGKVVLLNRAPTLHRLSIQAFEVVWMSDSNAIRLHPCVCSSFNADFDGDQMAVHLPLSDAAQAEARALMLSTRNLRSPATGEPTISISQEMVLGLFYLTEERPSAKGRIFADIDEALLALERGVIDVHTRMLVRVADEQIEDTPGTRLPTPPRRRIETTVGRLIFNSVLPKELRYKNYEMTKERLKFLIAESLQVCGEATTARLADALKTLGFTYATKSGVSFSVLSDIEVPGEKHHRLSQADEQVQEVDSLGRCGMITEDERYQQLIEIWTKATDDISKSLEGTLDPWGSLSTIIKSGATKAKFQQIRQLSGIRGLMASPSGKILPIPVRGNYLEGLKTWEIFIAGSGARKGFMDRSLNTARSGYLTRRLVEVGVEVWITQVDCGTNESLLITNEESRAEAMPDIRSRIIGRVLAEALPEVGLSPGALLDDVMIARILASGISAVRVRSPLTCEASYGICQQCYGTDLASGRKVWLGTAVGIIAGQSVGEPGTQLTMRTFHSGGVANAQGDITQGLPRVEELFDGRVPKNKAVLSDIEGIVSVKKDEAGIRHIHVTAPDEERVYDVGVGRQLLVKDGQRVTPGQALTAGHPDPQDILRLLGRDATARYLVSSVQKVYRATGVYLADKHIECIVRQMLRYVCVNDPGDTRLFPGEITDRFAYAEMNAQVLAQGGTPARAQPVLLGLTKAVLQTRSWIAAASFQDTSRVLMKAAIRGQRDGILGYKERLVLGRRIPTSKRNGCTVRIITKTRK